ncbi:hypothetical protein MCO_00575 [Bartonella sp. DB5-6]|nr:hypothetical protein MCO_00575 [Bartonella sp. DB5-6]
MVRGGQVSGICFSFWGGGVGLEERAKITGGEGRFKREGSSRRLGERCGRDVLGGRSPKKKHEEGKLKGKCSIVDVSKYERGRFKYQV